MKLFGQPNLAVHRKAPMLAMAAGLGLLVTVNPAFAQIWVSNGVSDSGWQGVASSADGNVLVAVHGNYGPICSSTNSGVTWSTNNAPDYAWISVASSADGTKLAAVGFDGPYNAVVYVSTNTGASWSLAAAPPGAQSYAIASSADGARLVLASWNNQIQISTNSGATWTGTGSADQYTTVACSADGTKLVAAGWNSSAIYTSTDSGATWTRHDVPYNSWWSSACSADGTKMVVVGRGCPIYLSSNAGDTWTEVTNAPQAEWLSVLMSGDGNKIVAWDGSDYLIYVSTNYGTTWTSNSPSIDWPYFQACLTASADGNKLVAASDFGAIYTAWSPPSPRLDIASSGMDLNLSWLVPSTNMVLQQKSDLITTNWSELTNRPVLNLTNLQEQVFLPPPSGSACYRLISK